MSKYKILNLYACLGGNRYKWDEVANIEVTAVELDTELARMYQQRFPDDKVVVGDAIEYLLIHFREFDFIWGSPPCPDNSRAKFWRSVSPKTTNEAYLPSFKLYEIVTFLNHWFDGKFCIESVVPYYEPLIPAKKRGRHLYWTNFNLPSVLSCRSFPVCQGKGERKGLEDFHKVKVGAYRGNQRKLKLLRNLVDYQAGKTILETALGVLESNKTNQTSLFNF